MIRIEEHGADEGRRSSQVGNPRQEITAKVGFLDDGCRKPIDQTAQLGELNCLRWQIGVQPPHLGWLDLHQMQAE